MIFSLSIYREFHLSLEVQLDYSLSFNRSMKHNCQVLPPLNKNNSKIKQIYAQGAHRLFVFVLPFRQTAEWKKQNLDSSPIATVQALKESLPLRHYTVEALGGLATAVLLNKPLSYWMSQLIEQKLSNRPLLQGSTVKMRMVVKQVADYFLVVLYTLYLYFQLQIINHCTDFLNPILIYRDVTEEVISYS